MNSFKRDILVDGLDIIRSIDSKSSTNSSRVSTATHV